VVVTVQLLELALLQRKYDLFTGGFLQPYSYTTVGDRLLFLAAGLWMDLFFFGTIAAIWFGLARRWRRPPLLAAYDFVCFAGGGTAIWLAVKFKVLSYFNDTLNFVVIRNLGGGSLSDALAYVADESVIFGGAMVLGVVLYLLGRRWVRRRAGAPSPGRRRPFFSPRGVALYAAFLVLSGVLVWWVNGHPKWRYGLSKKTSYQLVSRFLDEVSDVDRDGYGLFRFPPDPDNFDAKRYPGALDLPDNGVDEDGYAGDFHWRGMPPDALADLPPRPGKHILLIVLESARADLIGKRWKGRLVAPNLTRLAREGTSVPRAYSHTGYTTSSLQAIFNRSLTHQTDRVRLTDYLDASGYLLSFISAQDESFGNVAERVGMKGKGHYYFDARTAVEDRVFPDTAPGSLRLSEERLVQQFIARTGEIDWRKPNFIYVNIQAAHFPYYYPGMPRILIDHPIERSDIGPDHREETQATYWNAIAGADQTVGRIVARLKELGVYENTVMLILGDHGESLFDDGFLGHGHALNDIQTRIPFIINRPKLDIEVPLGQMDVAELLVRLATDRYDAGRWQRGAGAGEVFQLVGSLTRPELVGLVGEGGNRVVLDFRWRKLFFTQSGGWADFDAAVAESGDIRERAEAVVHAWEEWRWRDHLRNGTPD